MSNFIPMLSSSPPPIDDGEARDDWDDNDFGGFQDAATGGTDDFGNFATFNSVQDESDEPSATNKSAGMKEVLSNDHKLNGNISERYIVIKKETFLKHKQTALQEDTTELHLMKASQISMLYVSLRCPNSCKVVMQVNMSNPILNQSLHFLPVIIVV